VTQAPPAHLDAAAAEALLRLSLAPDAPPGDCAAALERASVQLSCVGAAPPPSLLAASLQALQQAWQAASAAEAESEALQAWLRAAYDACAAARRRTPTSPPPPAAWLSALFSRLESPRTGDWEAGPLRSLLLWAYRGWAGERADLRRRLGALLASAAAAPPPEPPPALQGALEACADMCEGLRACGPGGPAAASAAQLLALLLQLLRAPWAAPAAAPPGAEPRTALAPLAPALWRSLRGLLRAGPPRLGAAAAEGLAAAWPPAAPGDAPKCELLLEGLARVLEAAGGPSAAEPPALRPALALLAAAAGHERASVAARAARAAAAAPARALAGPGGAAAALRALLPPLLAAGQPHWSEQVRLARRDALLALRALDAAAFSAQAAALLGGAEAAAALLARLAPPPPPPAAGSEALSLRLRAQPLAAGVGFNDLVWCERLGSGAAATVHRCLVRAPGAPASAWRRVAAKRLPLAPSAGRPRPAAAAARELSALRAAAHPGCARLVAAFRYNAELVVLLELGERGDLQQALETRGSLAPAAAAFLAAELAAALGAVHSAGLAFGDLKCENVVLTASGHAKLADFGAARPLPGSAPGERAAGGDAQRALLAALRAGDWRSQAGLGGAAEAAAAADEAEAAAEEAEAALEGTCAYLSPQLVAGGAPDAASDAWALGCLLTRCLSGRLPLWAAETGALLRAIAAWEGLPAAALPAAAPPEARAAVAALLHPRADGRLGGGAGGMEEVAAAPWLAPLRGLPLHELQPPPMGPGLVAAGARAGASAAHQPPRLNSVLWSRTAGGTSLLSAAELEAARAGVEAGAVAETDAEHGAPWTQAPLGRPPSASRLRGAAAPGALVEEDE